MAGPAQEVYVSRAALANKPQPWSLGTPESAVRSYLDWTSYSFRIATSDAATPTMDPAQAVRVDSYIQYNLEKGRLIDQTLESISFGKLSVAATTTLVPAKERWTYRYVSTSKVGQSIGGPYTASYETTYGVVKSARGWLVTLASAKAIGDVK